MAHGLPDFGAATPKETIFGQVDLGELAARLGSICTYDRRGDVICLEDFSRGLAMWPRTGIGVASAYASANDRFRNRGISCKLTVGSQVGAWTMIQRSFPVPVYSNIGMETSFAIEADIRDFQIEISIFLGMVRHNYEFWLETGTGVIRIRNAGAWVILATDPIYNTDSYQFHTVKLVGDFISDKYMRLLFDHLSFDISRYSPSIVGAVGIPYMSVYISAFSDILAPHLCWVADVILTQNEP